MKKRIQALLSGLVIAAMTVGMLAGLTRLTERKASIEKYQDFFDEEMDFDVLFLGSSHMLNAVYPMELWRDHGIVSYNFGGHGNQLPTTYWVLQNVLQYTSPKLVVVDCYYLASDFKVIKDYSQVHLSMDALPFSATKAKGVTDLLDDSAMQKWVAENQVQGEKITAMGLLWDFSVYHERWAELAQDDFQPAKTLEKGRRPGSRWRSRKSFPRRRPVKCTRETASASIISGD